MDSTQESLLHAQPRDLAEGVGALLRRRRVELGLSLADVGNVVKLPARRIEAMEDERWAELPEGPYLRGFLRNIARALDLDATLLMERVDESLVRARSPDSILVAPERARATLPRRSGPAEERHSGRAMVVGAFVCATIAAMIAWSGTESFDQVVATGRSWLASRSGTPPPLSTAEAVRDVNPAGAVVPPSSSPAAVSPSPESSPAPASAGPAAVVPAASTPADEGTGVASASTALLFHFNEDAWVEVRGADGKVLLSRLNSAGSEQAIEGEAPYSLVVGNARGVVLRFRGEPVDLSPYTRDQVARFTLS